jgi:uncharacterized repeat protein (TIGR02543 family)
MLPAISVSASTTPTRPAAPRDVKAVAGNASAVVTFLLPSPNGANPITHYDLEAYPTKRIYACKLTDCEVRGLTNGVQYFFTVAAVNRFGTGPFSLSSNKVTPHILTAKITFNPNGGAGTMTNETANYDVATNLTVNAFAYTGYTFSGWNSAANGTGVAYADHARYGFTANATLYAQWTINVYSVIFSSNGGVGAMTNETANYDVATGLTVNAFTNTGHTFSGWNTAANGTGVAYADGANYAFAANVTLYAQWTANAYALIFNSNFPYAGGGSGSMGNETGFYNVATNLTTNAFIDAGFTFRGWNTAANGTGVVYDDAASYVFTTNAIVYAQWSANTDTVAFNSNFPLTGGGSGSMGNESFTSGTARALTTNVFSVSGYTFSGWNTAANGSGTAYSNGVTTTIYASVTLYAQWMINSYTVTFNSNFPNATGGLGSMSNETENYDVSTSLTANAFAFTGYNFNGWNTAANGSGVFYSNNATWVFTSNATLYAQWLVVPSPPSPGSSSTNWSGYVLSGNFPAFTQVSGGWRVPVLNCSDIPNSESASWVGTGGTGGEVLLQTGTENSCVRGSQQEVGWYEIFPSNPNQEINFTNFPVSPGDSMFATVTNVNGQWETILENLTTGRKGVFVVGSGWEIESIATNAVIGSFQATDSSQSFPGATSAEWIMEDPSDGSGHLLPFASYGTVTFTNLSTDLSVLTLPFSDSYQIVQGSVTLSVPTQVGGNSFSCNYTGP